MIKIKSPKINILKKKFARLSRRQRTAVLLSASVLLLSGAIFTLAELGGYGANGPDTAPNSLDYGLVGYWDMEEGQGQTIRDKSGNGNDCRLGDDTTVDTKDPVFGPGFTSDGPGGSGVVFDGINDYLDCGDDASLALTGAMTFGGWVRIGNLGEMHTLFGKGQGLGSLGIKGYVISYHNSGVIYFDTYSADGTVRDSMTSDLETITDTGWHHIMGYWDGTTGARGKRIYIDGMLANAETSSISSVGSGSYTFEISSDNASPWSYLNGAADEIRVYNRALSEDEIRLLYNQKRPIAQYDFNEGAGTIAHDSSFNRYDATLGAGSGSSMPAWTAGKEGSGLSFDGVDDYVTRAVNLDGDDGTVAMWLKDPDPDYWGYMFSSDANTRTYLEVSYGSIIFTKSDPAVEIGAQVAPAATVGWHHYELTWHTVNGALYASSYVDGNQYGNEVAIADDTDGTFFTLGAWSATPAEFSSGTVDNLRLYNYARTPDEVLADYNDGMAARFGSSAGGRWYSEDLRHSWSYRKPIVVTSSQTLDDYQTQLTLDTATLIAAGKLNADCSDLRFTGADGVGALPHWIQSGCNTASTIVWVRSSLVAGTQNIYMYYGSPEALSASSADATFIFYDDFDDGLGKWAGSTTATIYNDGGDNVLRLVGGGGNAAYTEPLPDLRNVIVESQLEYAAFGIYGPRLSQVLDPMQTIIECTSAGGDSGGAWHGTWLGYGSTELARTSVAWSTGTHYTSKFTTTSSSQGWAINGANLSGTYARTAVLSGRQLTYVTWDTDNDLRISWVRIRQYAATEPTHGTPGTEEVESSLVLHMRFDEGSGVTAHDESINHYDAAITGATWVPGVSGSALSFDGVDDVASVAISLNTDEMTQSFCMEELGGSQAWEEYLVLYEDASNYFGFTLDDTLSLLIPVVRIDGAWSDAPEVPLTEGLNCYTIVYSKAGGYRKTYVNGVLAGTYDEWNGGIVPTDLYISPETNSVIDNLRLYNYALTDAEVSTEYNDGMAAHLGKSNQDLNAGLVGYWNMEEGNGTTIYDRSGSGNDGTLNTASATEHALPFFAPGHDERGENGSGLGVTGRSEFVTAGTGSSLQLTSAGTIALWVRPNSLDQDDFANFVTKRATSNGGSYANYSYSFHWRGSEDLIRLAISDGVALDIATMPLPTDLGWHHMVGRWDGTDLRLYLDGVLAMTPVAQTRSAQAGAAFPVALAGYAFSSSAVGRQEFNGTLDEIRVYNRALSDDEIRQLYNQKMPIMGMNFDEGSGPTVYDESFNDNDGTVYGATWVDGKLGSALSFDGADDYVEAADSSSLDFGSGAFTLSLWLNSLTNTEVYASVIDKSEGDWTGSGNKTGFWLAYYGLGDSTPGNDLAFRMGDGGTSYDQVTFGNLQNVGWTHLVISVDSASQSSPKITAYRDGVLHSQIDRGITGSVDTTYGLNIGKWRQYGRNLNGTIDNVRIYNYARTADEVLVDYNNGLAAHLR